MLRSSINSRLCLILVGCLLLIGNNIVAQKNLVEGGYFFKIRGIHNFVGHPVDLNSPGKHVQLVNTTNDTVLVDYFRLRKIYEPHQIEVYNDRKFHYKRSFLVENTYEFGNSHFSLDFKVLKQVTPRWEIGLGSGLTTNSFYFATGSGFAVINTISLPTYLQGSYRIVGKRNFIYSKAGVGLANNLNAGQIREASSGFLGRIGVGIQFSSRNRFKHFLEFTQTVSTFSGTAVIRGDNVQGPITLSNVQFFNFNFTYGFKIGK